jgi:large subunit ribosomal protein L10e
MAKLRGARCHRRLKRAFTRTSKYRRKSYIKAAPPHKIIHFDSGNKRYEGFEYVVVLHAKKDINLRHNAIEAGRITSNRVMGKRAGKGYYGIKLRVFPHQIIRENPIAMGAGADRMSQGMRAAFGKSVSRSARVKSGQAIMQIYVQEKDLPHAKDSLRKAASKYPIACKVIVNKNKIYDPNIDIRDFVVEDEPEPEVETPTEDSTEVSEDDSTEETPKDEQSVAAVTE